MSRLYDIDPLERDAFRRGQRAEAEALCPPSREVADKSSFQSLGDALGSSFGAIGIKKSAGGEQLIRDIAVKGAFERAAKLGLSKEDAERRITVASEQVKTSLMECDSPIERRLLPALIFADYGERFLTFPAQLHLPKKDGAAPDGDLIVIPQFAFIKYRLDFAIIAKAPNATAIFGIECDGDAYHQDAEKDRQRDAYLKGFGIDITRFTGARIHADPHAAAQGIANLIAHWRNAHGG